MYCLKDSITMVHMHKRINRIFPAFIFIAFTSIFGECVSTTPSSVIDAYTCPSGFDLVTGQCRGVVQRNVNLDAADGPIKINEICTQKNGLLPIVRNAEDHAYWMELSISAQHLPIGIICNATSNKWIWVDGSKIEYKPQTQFADLDDPCSMDGIWFYYEGLDEWKFYDEGNHNLGSDIYCIKDIKKVDMEEGDCINFDNDESDSMCYQTYQVAEQWSDAQTKCKSVGANLASIHSAQENSFIRRLAVSNGFVDGLLLGGTASGKSNSFGWIDGSEWNYTNFIPGFPIDGFGDCLVMDTGDVNGLWANNDCNLKLPFVCSRKPFIDSPPQTCLGANIKEGDVVRTPGFPTDANTFCDFFLKVDIGKLVEIEVLLVEANSCCDHFIIEEGTFGGNVIANLTGAVGGLTFRTTSSNIMRASWQPNGAVNVRGAMFTFRGV